MRFGFMNGLFEIRNTKYEIRNTKYEMRNQNLPRRTRFEMRNYGKMWRYGNVGIIKSFESAAADEII